VKFTKSTLGLLLLAFAIWAGFIYVVVTDNNNLEAESDVQFSQFRAQQKTKSDTFSILLNYRDPFLNEIQVVKNTNTINISQKKFIPASVKVMPLPEVWPDIAYAGTIKNTNKNKTVALLKVNGNTVLLEEGAKIKDNIILNKVFNDSVWIIRSKIKKCIKK
jgi:hypothetical protein